MMEQGKDVDLTDNEQLEFNKLFYKDIDEKLNYLRNKNITCTKALFLMVSFYMGHLIDMIHCVDGDNSTISPLKRELLKFMTQLIYNEVLKDKDE